MKLPRKEVLWDHWKKSEVGLMGCQVRNIRENEFAHNKEKLVASLQLNAMKIALH